MIKFGFNKQKAIETILYLSSKDNSISKMRLLKFMFFADLYHINKYGRPILGDNYVAMEYGPVHSKLYDLIKSSCDDYKVVDKKLIVPKRKPNLDYFSKSDIEALEYAFNQYSQYDTFELSQLTHEYASWKIARERAPRAKSPKMYWENMIENEEIKEQLKEYAEAIVF